MACHFAPGQAPGTGDVENAGDAVLSGVLEGPDNIVLFDELDEWVEAGDARQDLLTQVMANRGHDVGPEHVGEAEHGDGQLGIVFGEVADEGLDLEKGPLELRPNRARTGVLLPEPDGVPIG